MNFKLAFVGCLGSAMLLCAQNVLAEKNGGPPAPLTSGAPSNLKMAESEEETPGDAVETTNSNPYAAIIARNVFRLQPPPPPPTPTNNDPTNIASSLKLTGFIKIEGLPLRAMFVNTPKDPKIESTYYSLCEGEREGPLSILKLNEEKEFAEVMNSGEKLVIWLKDSKPTNGPSAGPPQKGMQPQPVNTVAQGPQNSIVSRGGVAVAGGTVLPTPTPTANTQGGGIQAHGQSIPSRNVRGIQAAQAQTYQPKSAEESAALLLINSKAAGNNGPPMLPIPGLP